MQPGVAGNLRVGQQGVEPGVETLGGLAEEGLKAIVSSAGLAHIDSVFVPILQ